jgi:hypothetical protein
METMANNDYALMADDFKYYKQNKIVTASLQSSGLKLFEPKSGKTKIYSIDDIVGSSLGKGQKTNDQKSYLTFYIYPRKIKKRQRTVVILEFSKFESLKANLETVRKWVIGLNELLSRDRGFHSALY